MKNFFIFTFICFLSSNIFAQNIYTNIPNKIDTSKKYVFYLHGQIIEDQGINAVSEKYGKYEYEEILKSLAQTNIDVISEARSKNTDVSDYAGIVAAQIDSLLVRGVPVNNITVIGASKGGGIAVMISHILKNEELKFVIMSICNKNMGKFWKEKEIKLWGRVLYIFDTADEIAGSCKCCSDILENDGLKEYKEIEVKLGLGHGILYSPLKEWVNPALEWTQR
jgi:hypothetical protein